MPYLIGDFLHKSLSFARLQNAARTYKNCVVDIQQCTEDAIHVRSLVPASVTSATCLRS